MNYRTPERADALAAQYVLGTMSARARARFARLSRGDPVLAAAIRAWEDRLSPLAESVAPVEPPARVWSTILARIDRAAAGSTPERRTVWATVSLWRGLALTGFATAIALAFYQGLSHSELARHLKQPLGTVKSWIRRGLERLKACLDGAGVQR